MAARRGFAAGDGRCASLARQPKVYRGSRKRIRRIRWRENTTFEFWVFVVAILLMLILGVLSLINHSNDRHHEGLANTTVR
jgi:heme/copper-type cytochrome/quinol oxidase subunit 2